MKISTFFLLGLITFSRIGFATHLKAVHQDHSHVHDENCEHMGVQHNDHIDYLHDGHLHYQHGQHYDEHVLDVSQKNPEGQGFLACSLKGSASDYLKIRHGQHSDLIVKGRLYHVDEGQCHDHGPVQVIQ